MLDFFPSDFLRYGLVSDMVFIEFLFIYLLNYFYFYLFIYLFIIIIIFFLGGGMLSIQSVSNIKCTINFKKRRFDKLRLTLDFNSISDSSRETTGLKHK